MNLFKHHISFLVAVVILISALFVASIFSVFNYYSIYDQHIQSAKKSIGQLTIIVKETAAIAAYLDNIEIAQEVVNGLVKNDLVAYAKLTSINGLEQFSGAMPLQKKTQQHRIITYDLESPFIADSTTGKLIIYPNYQLINSNTKAILWNQTISLLSYTLVIAIFVFITINLILIRPLKKITSRLNVLSPGSDERIQSPLGHQTDEIGGLTKDINGLLQSMQLTLSSEHNLRVKSENLNKELNQANSKIKSNQLQIEKSHAEAVSANRAKSDFLAGMSHEIRTPMTAIIGLTDLLLKTGATPDQMTKLQKVQRASTSLLHIINDILDFSKIEAGKMQLEQVPFQLDEIISHLSALFNEPSKKRSNQLRLSIQPGCPCALIGDPVRLEQVLMNLIGNANKFTENGRITLDITCSSSTKENSLLTFKVKDSGIGIAKENLDKLFNAFSQADMSITRKFGGTGLGLSISSKIINKMGSCIEVKSELNKGSEFSFAISLQQQEGNQRTQAVSSSKIIESAYELSLKLLIDKHILIVEDNLVNQEVMLELLEQRGARVDIAEQGQIAIEKLNLNQQSNTAYDLVLMDIQMPVMDGMSACRMIRSIENYKHLPIIAVTAHAQDEQRQKCLAVGFDDFIIKPFKAPELLESIIKQLIRSHNIRVLLFEDNPINAEIFIDNINELGIHCDLAETISAGMALYNKQPYQMIFMDFHLPDGNGFDAAINIRAIEKQQSHSHTPIIAFTAGTTEEDKQNAINSGMEGILSKPFSYQQLLILVLKWATNVDSISKQKTLNSTHKNTSTKSKSTSTSTFKTIEKQQQVEILDSTLLNKMQKKPKLFARLIKLYLQTSVEQLADILLFIEKQDMTQLQLTAHSFKSSARQLGALSLGNKLEQIEKQAKNGSVSENIQQLLKEIQNEQNLVIAELSKF